MRRLNCRRYDSCLDKAARRDLPGLGCKGCTQFRRAEPEHLDVGTIERMIFLWRAVFQDTQRRRRAL